MNVTTSQKDTNILIGHNGNAESIQLTLNSIVFVTELNSITEAAAYGDNETTPAPPI